MNQIDKNDPSMMHFQDVLEEYYFGGNQEKTYAPLCKDCLLEVLETVLQELFNWAAYQPNVVLDDLFHVTAFAEYKEALRNKLHREGTATKEKTQ